ncbi:short-chain dehydrogenase [Reichenbachiella sp. 5M10]|uniref:SDR family NAD(P)-dependent oxidoreductase n=1 Tax=Reichenbachiella sp. 5M10 TaxID=1889772 RepID=UPI000C161BEE|nr:SDR family oxidoreductase [Reichenbachiella sp. 5M10]PIB34876.1 short-chain dehydrogenase [Reichenbachiella sp. 5M10]
MKKFDLTGKRAIVTGGGSGIGRAISLSLAGNGAKVSILELNEEGGQLVVDEIKAAGGDAETIACDVSKLESVQQAFDRAVGEENLDILVNNAGIAHVGNVENTTAEDLDRVYSVNVKGVYHCLQTGVAKMRDGGAIVNLSSIGAHVGLNDRFAYSMSKGAVHTMTLSIAKDYLGQQVRCNSISPARVHTPFVDGFISKNYPGKEEEMFEKLSQTQPIGRMGKPQEIGDLVLYLCSDEASFITGSDFPIDGGFVTLNGN